MYNKNFKSGFVAIIGRPNVGKSTFLNKIMSQKLAIVTSKAQTTRNKIQGIYTTDMRSEPVYSYRFILSDYITHEIIEDTGDLIHSVDDDTVTKSKRTSSHNFIPRYELEARRAYKIEYSITTINGYTTSV